MQSMYREKQEQDINFIIYWPNIQARQRVIRQSNNVNTQAWRSGQVKSAWIGCCWQLTETLLLNTSYVHHLSVLLSSHRRSEAASDPSSTSTPAATPSSSTGPWKESVSRLAFHSTVNLLCPQTFHRTGLNLNAVHSGELYFQGSMTLFRGQMAARSEKSASPSGGLIEIHHPSRGSCIWYSFSPNSLNNITASSHIWAHLHSPIQVTGWTYACVTIMK